MKANELHDLIYKDIADRSRAFNEELESEFHAVVKKFNLPLDREAIAAAGFVVAHDNNEPGAHSATITQHGKPVSRTIKMDKSRVSTDCLAPTLKLALIKDGVLCEVLDDLQRMTRDASKTLQELLNEPEQPDHNCTEITVDPESNLINRVVCLGKEYRTP